MPNKADIRTEMELIAALEEGAAVSQLALSKRLSISVGLVNALLRRAAKKGVAKAKAVPPKRWAYYLTPKGFAEKSRLVAAYLERSLAFFREARAEYHDVFAHLRASGVRRVVLVGRGELAEIALLGARENGIEIDGLLDSQTNEERLYGLRVLRHVDELDSSAALVITESREPQAAFDAVRSRYGRRRIEAPAFLLITVNNPGASEQ